MVDMKIINEKLKTLIARSLATGKPRKETVVMEKAKKYKPEIIKVSVPDGLLDGISIVRNPDGSPRRVQNVWKDAYRYIIEPQIPEELFPELAERLGGELRGPLKWLHVYNWSDGEKKTSRHYYAIDPKGSAFVYRALGKKPKEQHLLAIESEVDDVVNEINNALRGIFEEYGVEHDIRVEDSFWHVLTALDVLLEK